jgi:hypothetical protein
VRHLERFHLGTAYTEVAARLGALYRDPPLAQTPLAVDRTGVGRAVTDLLNSAGVNGTLVPVTITSGHVVTLGETGGYNVPKKELVSALQVPMQARRFEIARGLPFRELLARELENFRVKITAAANEVYESWREGDHDDLVLATAIAVWLGERCGGDWECPSSVPNPDPPSLEDRYHEGTALWMGGARMQRMRPRLPGSRDYGY